MNQSLRRNTKNDMIERKIVPPTKEDEDEIEGLNNPSCIQTINQSTKSTQPDLNAKSIPTGIPTDNSWTNPKIDQDILDLK